MITTVNDIKEAALGLPTSERAELAEFLLRSLDDADGPVDEDSVQAEWIRVAERRAAEMESGKVTGIPAEQVLKNLRSASR